MLVISNQPLQLIGALRPLKSGRHGFHLEAGVAAVELALILPVLLLILFGIIEFSVGYYNKAIITNASREAARAGVVYQVPVLTDLAIQNVATNYCLNSMITFGAVATPTVTVKHTSGQTSGKPLTVTVNYNYTGFALGPLMSPFVGTLALTAVTTMNYE